MVRLMVVDDEPIIADGICEIFQSMADLDLDICRAYSALEALDWLGRTRVDIVISDVRMPEMDGLQLLSEIRRNWPECHVIFLTGYSDFNSLYQASQYKVAFLLKSDGYDRLIRTVRETLKAMEERLNIIKRLDEARTQLGLSRQLVFRELLQGMDEAGEMLPAGMPIDTERPMLMAVGRRSRPRGESQAPGYSPAEAVCAALEQFFGKYMDMVYTQDYDRNIVCLLQNNGRFEGDGAGEFIFIKETLESVQEAVLRTTGFEMTFALSESPFVWEELQQRYRTLSLLIEYFSDNGSGAIVTEKNLPAIPPAMAGAGTAEVFEPEYSQSMRIWLESGSREEFMAGFSRFSAFLASARGKHNIAAAGLYMSMASLLINHVNRMGLAGRLEAGVRLDRLMELDSFADWQEAAALLHDLASAVFDIRSANSTTRAAGVIDKVKKYVRENVSGDLSLVRLADIVHFNPQYLSKLFKDTEGINLIDFISDVRMERAKQMLKNPSCKVQDVAMAAGYSNTANFCRFFRKHTGVAPNEYRER